MRLRRQGGGEEVPAAAGEAVAVGAGVGAAASVASEGRPWGRRTQRRYGALLDGGSLTVVTLEGDRVVGSDTFSGATPVEVLATWLAEQKPRGPVTVSVVAPSEETAEVPLSAGLATQAMREIIRDKVAGHFPKDAGPFAVVARLKDQDGGVTARVAAIPQRLVEGLWRVAKPNVRFTLPAMTYTTDGLHLAVCETSADLYLVEGGQVREAVALGCGGRRPAEDRQEPDLSEYADRVAEEVVQARNSWLRRRIDVAYDRVLVSGSGIPQPELTEAFRHRGVQLSIDTVTDRPPDVSSVGGSDSNMLRLGLALAAAVVDAGPVGYLDDGTRRGHRRAVTDQEGLVDKRLPKVLVGVVAVGILAAVAASVLPSLAGKQALESAQSAHARALSEQARYQNDIDLFQYNRALGEAVQQHQGLPWSTILPAIVSTVPAGVTLNTLAVNASGSSVKVTAEATAAPVSLVPQWLSVLQAKGLDPSVASVSTGQQASATAGASSPTTTTVTAPPSGTSSKSSIPPGAAAFTVTFTVPGTFR